MNMRSRIATPLEAAPEAQDRLIPVAVACGLVAAGALLWRSKPRVLELPEPAPLPVGRRSSLFQRAIVRSRDGVRRVAPSNIATSLGRSLVIAGAAILITRLLDELAGDDS